MCGTILHGASGIRPQDSTMPRPVLICFAHKASWTVKKTLPKAAGYLFTSQELTQPNLERVEDWEGSKRTKLPLMAPMVFSPVEFKVQLHSPFAHNFLPPIETLWET